MTMETHEQLPRPDENVDHISLDYKRLPRSVRNKTLAEILAAEHPDLIGSDTIIQLASSADLIEQPTQKNYTQ
jgi:hypothetical protein